MRPNRTVLTKKAGTAKLPRFCFVTVYFQVFCFVGRRRLRFPLREIPTVASFPRNDKLYGRERRFIRIDVIKTNVHPYRHCHCEERKARRGNLPEGKTDVAYTNEILLSRGISPLRSDYRPYSGRNDIIKQADKKSSPLGGEGGTSASVCEPSVRMRRIKPNKNVTSFSPHPSCLRYASAIHLPARSIATSPLWLKTVTCGLFLRCFTPPRRAPEGEGLTGCVYDCHLGMSREIPYNRNENKRTRPQTPARGGSPPRNLIQ